MEKPRWFSDKDVEDVIHLLRWFVKKLNDQTASDRIRPLRRTLKPKDLPGLFEYSNSDKRDFIVEVLLELSAAPYNVWNVSVSGDSFTVVLNYSSEYILREWLNMPLISASEADWRSSIEKVSPQFNSMVYENLYSFGHPGVYSSSQIIKSLQDLSFYLESVNKQVCVDVDLLSWRQLSARFFAGDSKYLDSDVRRAWLLSLFPSLGERIKERSILVSVALAVTPKRVLFIENWDSFCWLECIPEIKLHHHLVYTAGFKASAKDIRNRRAVTFFYKGEYSSQNDFERFWFSCDEQVMPAYFWGDLDFSGLQILESLAGQFAGLSAWLPGYQPMLDAIMAGLGHAPSDTGKDNQYQIGQLSCEYSNNVLLQALINTGLMLDQEWLDRNILMRSLIKCQGID